MGGSFDACLRTAGPLRSLLWRQQRVRRRQGWLFVAGWPERGIVRIPDGPRAARAATAWATQSHARVSTERDPMLRQVDAPRRRSPSSPSHRPHRLLCKRDVALARLCQRSSPDLTTLRYDQHHYCYTMLALSQCSTARTTSAYVSLAPIRHSLHQAHTYINGSATSIRPVSSAQMVVYL